MTETRILPIIALMIALLVPAGIKAQVPVDVSREKVIVGSKIYYMHTVLKNQTLYSISRAYKVSIAEIERENVIPVNGIQTGQVLRIPSREDQPQTPSQTRTAAPQPAQRSASSGSAAASASPGYDAATGIKLSKERIMFNGKAYFMHEVLKGQTLYSIARAYRVTILDIDRENAIPAGGLQAGQILRIPVASSLVVQEEVVPPPVSAQTKPATATDAAVTPAPGNAKVQEPAAGVKKETETEKAVEPAAEVKKEAEAMPKTETAQQPAATAPPRETTAQTAAPAKETPAKQPQPEKKKIHKVQKGESLADIAKKYNITVQELKQANKGVIFAMPDMRLVIPTSGDSQQQE